MKSKSAKNPLTIPLTPEEREIEDSIPPSGAVHASAASLAAVRSGLDELRDRRARGGARPGAGRKSKEHIPTTLNLSPSARARLEELASRQPGGMAGVVNRLLEKS